MDQSILDSETVEYADISVSVDIFGVFMQICHDVHVPYWITTWGSQKIDDAPKQI